MNTLWFVLLAAAAASPAPPRKVAAGDWGGEHAKLTVQESGAEIELDCAHGTFDAALALDAHGEFDIKGQLVSEIGPVRIDRERPGQPVRFKGKLAKDVLTLSIHFADGEVAGPYELAAGRDARLRKCR